MYFSTNFIPVFRYILIVLAVFVRLGALDGDMVVILTKTSRGNIVKVNKVVLTEKYKK